MEYMNREYSWLLFNERVLDQDLDRTNPLLERCKFLSIFQSNLDEFFMVRVGSLYNEGRIDPDDRENKTGLTASQQIDGILLAVRRLYARAAEAFKELKQELCAAGRRLLSGDKMTKAQHEE